MTKRQPFSCDGPTNDGIEKGLQTKRLKKIPVTLPRFSFEPVKIEPEKVQVPSRRNCGARGNYRRSK